MKKIMFLGLAIVLVAAGFIGAGFAYQSSYESNDNGLDGQFVTINQGGTGSAVLNYVQEYDTVVSGSDVYYYLPLDAGESSVKLNDSPYSLTITEKKAGGSYRLVAESDMPDLFQTSEKGLASWCQFLFKLTKGEDVYYGFTSLSNTNVAGTQYSFYQAEDDDFDEWAHADDEATIAAGAYSLDVYLVMCVESETVEDITGILVDKTNFVDQFDLDGFKIKFTVLGSS